MNNPLLSICIPTYNRSAILDRTLNVLIGDPYYSSSLVEIIVSDNSSSDNTETIVKKYPDVRYYKNEENIKDKNFSKVLSYAKGKYIKLFNDTLQFRAGVLKKILDSILYETEEVNLFFFENIKFLHCDKTIFVNSKKQLMTNVSYYTTWIANFGCWKSDFDSLCDLDRFAELQFVQVDWFYKLTSNGKTTKIIFDNYYYVEIPKGKGGYNIFNTFINNYLGIVKMNCNNFIVYEVEKYRLLRYFVFPWLYTLNYDNEYTFKLDNSVSIILKKYWYEVYLYIFLICYLFKKKVRV